MHIVLLHNPTAGSEEYSSDELARMIREAGHEVVKHCSKVEELRASLETSHCDLVAVAGGDGTVGAAGLAIAGCGVPLAVLPIGTANNIGLTLGLQGEPRELVGRWAKSPGAKGAGAAPGSVRSMDFATVTSPRLQCRFLEAAGFGIFPELIRRTNEIEAPSQATATLDRDLALFRSVVETAQPRRYDITIDGRDYSGEYILAQVMNIPFLGPNVPLASSADPFDGQLDVVLVGDADRALLLEVLARLRARQQPERTPVAIRGTRISMRGDDRSIQLDGELHEIADEDHRFALEIGLEHAQVPVLLPHG